MFKRLFKNFGLPQKKGTTENFTPSQEGVWENVHELELSNMEGVPSYILRHQLTVGSEIGNIVVTDPTVSPRHCTFILQQDVVSVIDHGSVAGTAVNGNQITPGKYIILEVGDKVSVGDLEVKIKLTRVRMSDDGLEEISETEDERRTEEPDSIDESKSFAPAAEEVKESVTEETDPQSGNTGHTGTLTMNKKNKALTGVKKVRSRQLPKNAANSILRVMGIVGDSLLGYTVLVVFLPFDDFRLFLDFVPAFLGELIGADLDLMWSMLVEDFPFISELLRDLSSFFKSTFPVGRFLVIFCSLRLLSTLVFGASFSLFFLGVRGGGNGIWSRVGGVIREIIGFFTWPFLVFDVPAVISRRTFKEFITFTSLKLSSSFAAIVGTLLYMPLLMALALISPLFQGFEPPEALVVNEQIQSRVKTTIKDEEVPVEAGALRSEVSTHLGFELTYNPKHLMLVPKFQFEGHEEKVNYNNGLVFYDLEIQKPVTLEIFKRFDFKQLVSIAMKGNVFLYDRFPMLRAFVYENEGNPAFRVARGPKELAQFTTEFIDFCKLALTLDLENALEVMQSETLFIKNLIDFKRALVDLADNKHIDQVGFMKIGNATFLRMVFMGNKPFDLLMPILSGPGRIFKVSFETLENLNTVSNKFYKFSLEGTNWFPHLEPPQIGETLTPTQVVDLFSKLGEKKLISPDLAQALYGYYFERSTAILSSADEVAYITWKDSLEGLLRIIEILEMRTDEDGTDPKTKLLQNFRELKGAVDAKNLEFFGISQTEEV